MHDGSLPHEGVPLRAWEPELPGGRYEAIYLHWSGGDYATRYPAYHFCIGSPDRHVEPYVYATHNLTANMRELRSAPTGTYAAHTAGRNSYAIGLAVMCMHEARPDDFGPYPLNDALVDGLCVVARRLADFYRIPIAAETIMTHAEAACADGYFGSASDELRWDIARLEPSARPLVPAEAALVGAILRAKIEHAR